MFMDAVDLFVSGSELNWYSGYHTRVRISVITMTSCRYWVIPMNTSVENQHKASNEKRLRFFNYFHIVILGANIYSLAIFGQYMSLSPGYGP